MTKQQYIKQALNYFEPMSPLQRRIMKRELEKRYDEYPSKMEQIRSIENKKAQIQRAELQAKPDYHFGCGTAPCTCDQLAYEEI